MVAFGPERRDVAMSAAQRSGEALA
jgi:hypothetical protein